MVEQFKGSRNSVARPFQGRIARLKASRYIKNKEVQKFKDEKNKLPKENSKQVIANIKEVR
jgi:hypothetical protein